MKVIGIIAEYNPLHTGHAYQLQYAKEVLGADYCVIVMSGPFTQRGIPAIFDKYTRADAAINCGADLVLELPVCHATASAEGFAEGALKTLASTGIVDTVLFGSETPDIDCMKQTAHILLEEPEVYTTALRQGLAEGLSFPKARSNALSQLGFSVLLDTPNNILGVEYCKAIEKFNLPIEPVCMQRIGSDYHEKGMHLSFASASGIRESIFKGDIHSCKKHFPAPIAKKYEELLSQHSYTSPDDFSEILYYSLRSQSDYTSFLDCNEPLSNKILQNLSNYDSYDSFCDLLKSKDIARSRISRVMAHILLQITTDEYYTLTQGDTTPYLRVLEATQSAAPLFQAIKKRGYAPIVTSPKNVKTILSPKGYALLQKDIFAADIYQNILSRNSGMLFPNEYTHHFKLKD